jgi:hypothetical protein
VLAPNHAADTRRDHAVCLLTSFAAADLLMLPLPLQGRYCLGKKIRQDQRDFSQASQQLTQGQWHWKSGGGADGCDVLLVV